MKRGFLNTPKAKRVVEEVYAPDDPPASKPSLQHRDKQSVREPDSRQHLTDTNEDLGRDEPADDLMSSIEDTTTPSESAARSAFSKSLEHPGESLAKGRPIIRPPPGRPGWGYHPLEEHLHRAPPSHGNAKRAVFCRWPRDPDGKLFGIPNERGAGKLSADGLPWGATLYDFFWVNKVPEVPGITSVMTSSQLLHAMKGLGESFAKDCIKWAESEPDPRDETFPVAAELIEDRERVVKQFGIYNHCSAIDEVRKVAEHDQKDEAIEDEDEDEDEDKSEESEGDEDTGIVEDGNVKRIMEDSSCLNTPVTSPFHPSHYPSPWPFIPFTADTTVLQDRIPFYLLPQTLHVHDPFDLLPAIERRPKDTSWTSKPDIIHTYTLNLIDSAIKGVKEARERAEAVEEFKARTLIIIRYERTQEQKDNFEPVIEVPLPPYVKRPTKIEESHLYLSPAAKVGEGHHSLVYNAEWELPRDLFTKQKICSQCFQEALEKEKKRLKDIGRWDKMLSAAGWGPKGFTGVIPTEADMLAVNDPFMVAEGEIIEREVTCVVPPGATPMDVLQMLDDRGCWDIFQREKHMKAFLLQLTDDEVYPDVPSKVPPTPVVRVNPSFSYHDPSHADTVCSHLPFGPVPRTAKFSVVAKLSIRHDTHLGTEAENYQLFPDHFFQHWSGYIRMSQLHTIVPVKAIVPQFYGYYKPQGGPVRDKPYLSPILLIEHCGTPIDPDTLSFSDKVECASLLLRFQEGGWLHESVFARNLLVQHGSPTLYPMKRMTSQDLSFRLIDFGRSKKLVRMVEKQQEERSVLMLFSDLIGSMGITFERPTYN